MPKLSHSLLVRGALIVLFILVAGAVYYYISTDFSPGKKKKYIAYIGRYTNYQDTVPADKREKNKFDLMHEVALQELLQQLDLPYHQLELKTYDCERNGEVSRKIYEAIAADSNVVMVIDNTWGEHISRCHDLIREKNIPVISLNADRNSLDYGNNVIFAGNNDHVPHDISAFITKVLKKKKVNFISETDYPVHQEYLKAFAQNQIEVNFMLTTEKKDFKNDSARFYQEWTSYLQKHPEEASSLWVINTHVDIGNGLIHYADKHFKNIRLLGHSYIINPSNLKKFGENNDNELILISSPTDAVSHELYNDIEKLKAKYPAYMQNPNHPMFIKRCQDAVEMVKNKFEDIRDTFSLSKTDFIKFFRTLPGRTITEDGEIYEFDSTLTVLPELYFAEYSKGTLHSYPLQLNLEREVIPNLFFGMEIVDIYNIDMDANSFTADFYYWVKLDSANQEAEKFIIFQNMKQNESSRELVFEKTDRRTIYKLYKVSGVFYVNYILREYPFDTQELFIRAEILSPATKLKVSFDARSFALDPKAIDKFKITEWNKLKYYVTVDNEVQMGMHGDPDIEEEKWSEFKNIYFRLVVNRKSTTPMLEIILPLVLIGIISISLLFLKDISFENLGEVSIGVFMSIVAFSISFSATTPTSDDLTRADLLFWLTFIVVLLNFFAVIILNAIYDEEEVKKIDIRKISVGAGVLYIGAVSYVLMF